MKKIILFIVGILLITLIYFWIDYNVFIDVEIINNTVEINTYHEVNEFVGKVINAKLIDSDKKILFDKLGENKINIKIKNKIGKVYNDKIVVNVVDTEKPVLECQNITSSVHDNIDMMKYIKVTDNSNDDISLKLVGSYDINKTGKYSLTYFATDISGNTSECSFTLTIKDKIVLVDSDKYYIRLNKTQNVLMVYSKDDNGNYTNLEKTFVVSAGNATPTGIYKIKERHKYISFTGGAYGRYGIRITGPYWFHSVPYNGLVKNGKWSNISFKEYNKLGSLASHGCIRLQVSDVKWLYDNIPKGTKVDIYEGNTLPEGVVKPTPHTIDVTSPNRGWDPTDPDPDNPWNK